MDVTFADISLKFPELMEVLDEKSKALFWCIWRNRHVKIRELSGIINAPTDLYTLSRLKEVINPQAEQIVGKPLLTFEKSKIDPLTGEKVLFSWWLNEECFDLNEDNEFIDIFDEQGRVKIIMKLPDLSSNEVAVAVEQNIVYVSADTYQKKIPLLYNVNNEIKKTCRNGILELSLEKT